MRTQEEYNDLGGRIMELFSFDDEGLQLDNGDKAAIQHFIYFVWARAELAHIGKISSDIAKKYKHIRLKPIK